MDISNVDIAALSMQMATQKTQSDVSVAMMKKTMDAQTEIASTLIDQLMVPTPSSGHVDISI